MRQSVRASVESKERALSKRLDWRPAQPVNRVADAAVLHAHVNPVVSEGDSGLWSWLRARRMIEPWSLPGFFGISVVGENASGCSAALWQACIYYRFVH